jgi:hypothetical protein
MTTNPEFVDAACKLVDAVTYAECTVAGSLGGNAVLVTADAARAVLRKIRATAEIVVDLTIDNDCRTDEVAEFEASRARKSSKAPTP